MNGIHKLKKAQLHLKTSINHLDNLPSLKTEKKRLEIKIIEEENKKKTKKIVQEKMTNNKKQTKKRAKTKKEEETVTGKNTEEEEVKTKIKIERKPRKKIIKGKIEEIETKE